MDIRLGSLRRHHARQHEPILHNGKLIVVKTAGFYFVIDTVTEETESNGTAHGYCWAVVLCFGSTLEFNLA